MPFCQSVTLSTLILRQVGYEWVLVHPRSLSQTHSCLHSQKLENFDPEKGLAQYKLGDSAKPWPVNGTVAFAKNRERTQNFLTFSPSWPSVTIRIGGTQATHATCVFLLPPVPLCLSPTDFLDNPYLTFHSHMISRKGF